MNGYSVCSMRFAVVTTYCKLFTEIPTFVETLVEYTGVEPVTFPKLVRDALVPILTKTLFF